MIFLLIIIIEIFILCLIFLALALSSLEINIEKFQLNTVNKPAIDNILIYIKLKLFNHITFFKFKIDNKKIEKMKNSKLAKSKLLKKAIDQQKEVLKKEVIKMIKVLDIELKQINLKIVEGLTDIMLTIFAVPVVSMAISMLISKTAKKYKKEKYKYTVIPNYNADFTIKIQLNCIINIKLAHIMKVIYILLKKGSEKNDERTSNRRTYVCSNG